MLDANRMHAGGVLLLCIRRIGLSRCGKKASARIMIFFARFYFQLVCLLEIRSFSVVSKYLFSADFFLCGCVSSRKGGASIFHQNKSRYIIFNEKLLVRMCLYSIPSTNELITTKDFFEDL